MQVDGGLMQHTCGTLSSNAYASKTLLVRAGTHHHHSTLQCRMRTGELSPVQHTLVTHQPSLLRWGTIRRLTDWVTRDGQGTPAGSMTREGMD